MSDLSPLLSLAPAAEGLDALRQAQFDTALKSRMALAGGLRLRADRFLRIRGSVASHTGRLLDISARMGGRGTWFALHVPLGPLDLEGAAALGVMCRATSPDMQMLRIALRSGTGPDTGRGLRLRRSFQDAFLDKHVLAAPEARTHLDALTLAERPDVPRQAPWRELLVFLPVRDMDMSLQDLRLFVV